MCTIFFTSHNVFFMIKKELILPKKVRMKYQPPLHGVKKLIVVLMSEQHIRVKLVETLLWLAPCLESLSIYNEYISDCKIFKVFFFCTCSVQSCFGFKPLFLCNTFYIVSQLGNSV